MVYLKYTQRNGSEYTKEYNTVRAALTDFAIVIEKPSIFTALVHSNSRFIYAFFNVEGVMYDELIGKYL